jgi:hypothetical protein
MPGPRAAPGTYRVILTTDSWSDSRNFEVRRDPRLIEITDEHLREQFEFLMQVRSSFERLNGANSQIRELRAEVDSAMRALGGRAGREIEQSAERLRNGLQAVEETLIQTRPGGWANEPKIRGHLSWVATAASSQRGIQYDARPTDQLWERYRDLAAELEIAVAQLQRIIDEDMNRFRTMLRAVTDDG